MVPAVSIGISPVPTYSGYQPSINSCSYRTITPYGLPSQTIQIQINKLMSVLLPRKCLNIPGLGSSLFARHYLGNHCCFLFLQVLRCFSSPRSPSLRNTMPSAWWVAPFGYLRIISYLPIPVAFRSLSRPSSPL